MPNVAFIRHRLNDKRGAYYVNCDFDSESLIYLLDFNYPTTMFSLTESCLIKIFPHPNLSQHIRPALEMRHFIQLLVQLFIRSNKHTFSHQIPYFQYSTTESRAKCQRAIAFYELVSLHCMSTLDKFPSN